jgi:hypothetical protein
MSDMTGVASHSTWFSARYQRDVTDLTHSVGSDMRATHMRVTVNMRRRRTKSSCGWRRYMRRAGVVLPDRRQLSLQIVVLEGLDR